MIAEVLPKTKRAAVYARVSTDDQAENGYSLDDQEKKGYAQTVAKDWAVVDTRYVDDGVSGTLRHRPALDRMLRDVEAGKIDVVVVTKMDRLARNLKLLLEIWDTIEACGATVVVIDESIDTNTSVGRLIRNVLGSIAEFERDQILARTRAGHIEKHQGRGHAWRSRPPYGYLYVPGEGRAMPGSLTLDPDTAPVVRRIFESVASGMSASAVAVALTADCIPTQRGARSWVASTVQAIIHNPIYYGQAAWGRKTYVTTASGAKKQRKQADPNAIIYATVPAIISRQLAEQAEAQLKRNRVFAKRHSTREYLLRGLLRCGATNEDGGTCSYVMCGHQGRRYQCGYYTAAGQRRSHSIALKPVEDAVWDALRSILLDPARVLDQARALADSSSTEAQELDAQLAQITKDAAKTGAKQDALLDLYLGGDLSKEQYAAKSATLEAQRQEFHTKAAELQSRRDAAVEEILPVVDVEVACAWAARGIDNLTFEERQFIVRALCTRITATKESVIIEGFLPILNTTVPLDTHAGSTIVNTLSPS